MYPQPSPLVVVDASDVEVFLQREFSLTLAELAEFATEVTVAFSSVTALHPRGFNGTSAWAAGTRFIRAAQIPKGWRLDDPQNQPRVVSKDGRTAITVSSGNEFTGVANRNPSTRNDKGTQTKQSLSFNRAQGQLFGDNIVQLTPQRRADAGQELWVLLYYIDLEFGEFRFELSRPINQSETGHIVEWSERYIVPAFPLRPMDRDDSSEDDAPDIDFNVTPKRG